MPGQRLKALFLGHPVPDRAKEPRIIRTSFGASTVWRKLRQSIFSQVIYCAIPGENRRFTRFGSLPHTVSDGVSWGGFQHSDPRLAGGRRAEGETARQGNPISLGSGALGHLYCAPGSRVRAPWTASARSSSNTGTCGPCSPPMRRNSAPFPDWVRPKRTLRLLGHFCLAGGTKSLIFWSAFLAR